MAIPNHLESGFKITAIGRRRVHESVADQIRQAIFGGLLAPGHKLPPEREMAKRFQTSRLALREALRDLEKEGMITIKPGFGGGAVVAGFDHALRALLDSLNTVVKLGDAKSVHLSEVRTILEPEIARLASLRATPDDLRAIEGVVLFQERKLETGGISRELESGSGPSGRGCSEFHSRMAEAAHNPVLQIVANAVNESIRDPISRSKLTPAMRSRVVTSHRSIFEAIRGRDVMRAKSAMTEHIADVQCHLDSSDQQ
jgi:GntR family transcriptional regulator, transcriptional repressor for pyruvate dehydrogenase complex